MLLATQHSHHVGQEKKKEPKVLSRRVQRNKGKTKKNAMVKKVCVVTSSRADFSKMEPIYLGLLREHDKYQPHLVVSGTHLLTEGGSTWKAIQEKYDIAAKVITVVSGDSYESMAESVALGISKFTSIFSAIKPDYVVVHGDRFDALSVAIASSLLHICTVHVEGGELSGTIDGSLRHAITKLSHVHFVCNKRARSRLLQMGEDPDTVMITGCPSYDRYATLDSSEEAIKAACAKWNVEPKKFVLVMHHPDTVNPGNTVEEFKSILHFLCELPERVLFFYPNIDPGNKIIINMLQKHREGHVHLYRDKVSVLSHVPFEEFALLLQVTSCIAGNSSSIVREACFFGTPAILVGNRQEGRDMGTNVRSYKVPNERRLVDVYSEIKGVEFQPQMMYGAGNAVRHMLDFLLRHEFRSSSKSFNDDARTMNCYRSPQTQSEDGKAEAPRLYSLHANVAITGPVVSESSRSGADLVS